MHEVVPDEELAVPCHSVTINHSNHNTLASTTACCVPPGYSCMQRGSAVMSEVLHSMCTSILHTSQRIAGNTLKPVDLIRSLRHFITATSQ